MLRHIRLVCVAVSLLLIHASSSAILANPSGPVPDVNKLPLAFTKNMGQWNERVLFRANASGATFWFTKDGVTYQFIRHVSRGTLHVPAGTRSVPLAPDDRDSRLQGKEAEPDSIEQLVLTAKFVGANPNPEIITEGQMEYKCNYFIGNEPSKWHTDVPNFYAVTLKNIYPGIDVRYSGDGTGQATYNMIVSPGADISQIRITYDGAEEIGTSVDGEMTLRTKWGDITANIGAPTTGSHSGAASLSRISGKTIGFASSSSSMLTENGVNKQTAGDLTYSLSYSTYLGGSNASHGSNIIVDKTGHAFVAGSTAALDFPIKNPYQSSNQGQWDVFVAKFNKSGNALLYCTYVGGNNLDESSGLTIDANGDAYVTGYTASSNFPTQNPVQSISQGGLDAFMTELNQNGNALIFSTYLSGSGDDEGFGIAIDSSGHIYVAGETTSTNFPIQNAYQPTNLGYWDLFVTKLDPSSHSLIFSTYLGGWSNDWSGGIAVDVSGNAFIVGFTGSTNFPLLNAYQSIIDGGADISVTKLRSDGGALLYSTLLGGNNYDYGVGIAVDGKDCAYVTGWTRSTDFPTSSPFQSTPHSYEDVIVAKLDSTGSGLIYSTYIGGDSTDIGYGITVNTSGNAFVTGETWSHDFPTSQPYQSSIYGGMDAFVLELSQDGSSEVYSTFLGGNGGESGRGIAIDGSGSTYVTGSTSSFDYPLWNPYQSSHHPGQDVFVTKLSALPGYLCGDADGNEFVNISDVVYLISYIFSSGPAPVPLIAGDTNCDAIINISDAVYLISYIFAGGPVPCATCK